MTDRPLSHLDALAASIRRLRGIVEPLDDTAIAQPAYPREWTIAQVMSHLGSGAVIMQRRFEAAVAGAAAPDEFAPSVWEEWNAKSPRAQVDDALAADAALAAALEALSDEEREGFSFATGPIVSASRVSSGSGSTSTPCTPGTSRSPSTTRRRSRGRWPSSSWTISN